MAQREKCVRVWGGWAVYSLAFVYVIPVPCAPWVSAIDTQHHTTHGTDRLINARHTTTDHRLHTYSLTLDEGAVKALVRLGQGDMRRVLNVMQVGGTGHGLRGCWDINHPGIGPTRLLTPSRPSSTPTHPRTAPP